ncbi:hypothetical protein [Azonexus sp.]|jgi:hypothetical protein|uniref:hypothetical protein n=1 Tax=Azonexus sp. TaxID=1872668 RepID=UPI00283A9301|nr:hypothetical protein [Azonexus sp.]
MALTISGNRKLAFTATSLLINPSGEPEDRAMPGFWTKRLVSANARDAGNVVSPQAGADPDLMLKLGMTGKQEIAVGNGGGQRLLSSAADSVGKRASDFFALALNGNDPGVHAFRVIVDACDIAMERHVYQTPRDIYS